MPTELSCESLIVYKFYLDSIGLCDDILPSSDEPIVARDHLDRAIESVGINLMRANAQEAGSQQRLSYLNISIASTHECAAALDVCYAKDAIEQSKHTSGLNRLWRIRGMLIGLKRTDCGQTMVKEDEALYGPPKFPHAELDMYKVALTGVRWTHELAHELTLMARTRRKLDISTTGTVLNIAEGHARTTVADQNRFMKTALEHAFQTILQYDLLYARHETTQPHIVEGTTIQTRVISMLQAWRNKNKHRQEKQNPICRYHPA